MRAVCGNRCVLVGTGWRSIYERRHSLPRLQGFRCFGGRETPTMNESLCSRCGSDTDDDELVEVRGAGILICPKCISDLWFGGPQRLDAEEEKP